MFVEFEKVNDTFSTR